MINTHSRCPVRWHHFNALRWGKQKKEKKEKKNTSGRKRIGGMTTAHIVTKRGPMVHGIQFYISRVLKDKKGRETKSKKKKEEGERKRRCLLRSFDIFETLFIADTYIRPLFPPGRADPRWDGNSMEIPNYKFAKFIEKRRYREEKMSVLRLNDERERVEDWWFVRTIRSLLFLFSCPF